MLLLCLLRLAQYLVGGALNSCRVMAPSRDTRHGCGRGLNRTNRSQTTANMAVEDENNHDRECPSTPPDTDSTNDLCSTCNITTMQYAVGCDRCSKWFYPSSMCMGIPDQLVNSIREYGDGIAFICTECRTGSGGGGIVSDSAFKQLFLTVKEVCETVQTLSAQVAVIHATGGPGQSLTPDIRA